MTSWFAGAVTLGVASVAQGASEPKPMFLEINGQLLDKLTSQPIGSYNYCKRVKCPSLFVLRNSFEAGKKEPVRFADISGVHKDVNATIKPKSDFEVYGVDEVWGFPRAIVKNGMMELISGKEGDCEDYVLQKRKLLIARGVSPDDLFVTVVIKPKYVDNKLVYDDNGKMVMEGHAILLMRYRHDYKTRLFVLDNLLENVVDYQQTITDHQYQYLKYSVDLMRWYSFPKTPAVDLVVTMQPS